LMWDEREFLGLSFDMIFMGIELKMNELMV